MDVDADEFRNYYESLSDEALLALNREELVDIARACYDSEVAHRRLTKKPAAQIKREDLEPSSEDKNAWPPSFQPVAGDEEIVSLERPKTSIHSRRRQCWSLPRSPAI